MGNLMEMGSWNVSTMGLGTKANGRREYSMARAAISGKTAGMTANSKTAFSRVKATPSSDAAARNAS